MGLTAFQIMRLREFLLRIKFIILGRDWEQRWFWTPEWQAGEREADEDIRQGRYKTYDSVEDLIKDLELE